MFRPIAIVAACVLGLAVEARAATHETIRIEVAEHAVASPEQPAVMLVVEPSHAFDEALVSINAQVPPGALAAVYLRVRSVDGAWSPWMFVLDWAGEGASPLDGPHIMRSSLGRINIDYFVAVEPVAAAQLRVDAVGGIVTIADATVTFSSGVGDASATGRDAVERVELAVPFRSQKAEDPSIAGRICSPTSVAMVLEYHGIEVGTQLAADTIYDPRHDLFGNWPRAVQGAFSFGAPGYLTRFSDWQAVRDTLERGSPIIASIRVREGELPAAPYASTAGHLIVITGLDGKGNAIVNDCAASTAEDGAGLLYPLEDMENVWFRGSNGTAYVLLPPA